VVALSAAGGRPQQRLEHLPEPLIDRQRVQHLAPPGALCHPTPEFAERGSAPFETGSKKADRAPLVEAASQALIA
jgi:hypothetical protein